MSHIDGANKFLIILHALLAFTSRHAVCEAGNDRESQIVAVRSIENYAEFINECELAAIADKSGGRALGNINADAIGRNALHAGRLYPGDLLDFAAATIERDAQHAATTVFIKRREYCFTRDDVIAGDLNLLRLEQ